MTEDNSRKVVVPGEVIFKGNSYLPGEWTEKKGDEIVAMKYGLAEESNNLVKVIPISGVYIPRRGNVVIGKVEMITFNGWVVNIGASDNGFLSVMEVPRFVNKDAMEEVFDIGDMVVAKIWNINKRGTDLSIKSRGLGNIDEGMIIEINPNKVPRVIGKEGSMIKIVKDATGCDITVGQNGLIWIYGKTVDDELFAKKTINYISENSHLSGLTEHLTKWIVDNKK